MLFLLYSTLTLWLIILQPNFVQVEQMAGGPIHQTEAEACTRYSWSELALLGFRALACVSQPARKQIFGRTYQSTVLISRKKARMLPMATGTAYDNNPVRYRLHSRSQTDLFPLSCTSPGTQSHHPSQQQALCWTLKHSVQWLTYCLGWK